MPDEIVIRYRQMGGQENTYQHGSGEQVTFPNNQQPPAPLSSLRDNPNLLRIHADDQDKKTICIFWSLLLCLLILLAIVANFAIPSIYVRNSLSRSLSGTSLEGCANPASFSGDTLVCSSNPLYFGEVVVGWTPANQFGLLYLQVRPNNMTQLIKIDQKYLLQLYSLRLRASSPKPVFQKVGRPNGVNATIQFSSDDADYIYADDGRTVIGYQYLLAIIVDFDNDPFLQQIQFSQTLPSNAPIRLQSYAINSRFTVFTIVIRYFYFVLAILGCILYLLRYLKVPAERKTIEQKMVAVASVLLIMFNDPFYPITVLKPNGASAFFSLFFIVNLITFLLLLWLVFADRIYFEDGQQETVQLTKKKVAYVGLVWIILIICLMAYTMQQVDGSPIVPHDFSRRYTAARVIIALVVLVGIVYIAIRFVKSCMAPQGRTWRSTLFMCFSSAFIVAIFIILVSNALVPYNYSGSTILVVYSLINVYIYYLQYMYAITREQVDKLDHPEPVHNDNYDVITVGTIDLVDVNLDDDDEAFSNSNLSANKQEKKKEEKQPFGQEEFE